MVKYKSPGRLFCTNVNKCFNSINYFSMVYPTLRIDNCYDNSIVRNIQLNSGSKHISNLGVLCCLIVPLPKQHNSFSSKHTLA
jgi:hypothetical protein